MDLRILVDILLGRAPLAWSVIHINLECETLLLAAGLAAGFDLLACGHLSRVFMILLSPSRNFLLFLN